MFQQPLIEDLALISDRNTCAVLDKKGAVQWYCPDRFDGKAVLSGLVDNNGGYWTVSQGNADFVDRAYLNSSSILRQNFKLQDHEFYIDDWMPMNRDYAGIVRQFSTSPVAQHNVLKVKGDDGAAEGKVTLLSAKAAFFEKEELYLYCSHTIYGDNPGEVSFTIPEGQDGWAYLSSYQHNDIPDFAALKEETLAKWEEFLSVFEYTGLYQSDVKDSLRAILQLTCGKTGGILAAATTSLPEVIGGERNYDYRYVWVRDAALITAALSVLETDGELEFGFLEFMYQAMKKNTGQCVYPLYTIDYQMIDHLEQLDATGYLESRPVQVGNIASEQRQLDAEANVLISGYIIYDKYGKRLHWKTMQKIANFICENWHKPENGIWEEGQELQYTAGKVYSALGLEMMSRFNEDEKEAAYWKEVAKEIRDYVSNNCMTPDGAFANYAGSDETDISSVLYVIFGYVEANAPEMLATIKLLEDHYQENNLYRRTLVEFDSAKEGAFLAGSCWMAHYYAVAGDFEKSRQILDAVKACQNDLGFFSEEADPLTGRMLGNFDQTFVHSSFICAANGLTREIEGTSTVVRVP